MDLWQWHCQNRREKKFCIWFVAMPLPKQGKKNCDKKIGAMALPKQGKKNLRQTNCGNAIAEIGEKNVTN